ncbi:unnamed protein product [Bursaphelenchus okinawaensis]|uniref:G-protein coupled receptors family 1 profile domain-containing protein n=1 Tax=Bursaphelenchus okinawaensis TaxID=465554 RepID=A0A811L5F9_9BILA|nr:unnamed protein product [Bursaphelenchus okinawaensis]CAG9117617.1 unnamed protein product [Bursaphelenchus okinawaensis]
MSWESFCEPDHGPQSQVDQRLKSLQSLFRTIMILISLIGVAGNVLNLITLRSPSLRTVPFMYIRALAIFDLVGLTAVIIHFLLQYKENHFLWMVYYEVWIEDVLINSFLVAGLYAAVLLTVERYLLIRKPHKKRLFSIQHSVSLKISGCLLMAIILHCPMALQNTAKVVNGRIIKGNNQRLLCRDPWWTLFSYYKMFRETVRFTCVILLVVLNTIIARSLQMAKRNRRLLIKRTSGVESNEIIGTPLKEKNRFYRKDMGNVMKSFTEKKLTALMVCICLIYLIGNLPQMVVMVLQNETMENRFGFQVFRNIANTLEVLNHCLNFFIFCMASSEYSRAFLLNCRCIRRVLVKIPACASVIHSKRLSNVSEQKELPSGEGRRKSSLFYDPDHRRNTVCMQINSTTTADSKISAPSRDIVFEDCVVYKNQIPQLCSPDSGDEYL